MIRRFNTLKLTPQVLITTGLFAIVATFNIGWGLVLCLIALPALTLFNYAKGKPLVARILYTALSLVAGFIALLPAMEIDSNRRVSACNIAIWEMTPPARKLLIAGTQNGILLPIRML